MVLSRAPNLTPMQVREAMRETASMAENPNNDYGWGIINAFCGCAGERCMALPTIVVENAIADRLVEQLVEIASEMKLGPAYDKATDMGPVVNAGHRKFVTDWIQTGVDEGAKLLLACGAPGAGPPLRRP